MDPAFLVLVAVALGFISLLIAVRANSAGASARRIGALLAELWAVFAIWIGVLWAAAGRLGVGPSREPAEWRTVLLRFSALSRGGQALLVVSLLLGVAVFVHLMWALGRGMGGADSRGKGA